VTAIVLALVASLSWGAGDFLGGVAARRLALLAVLLVSQGAGLAAIALVVAVRADPPPDASFVPFALLSSLFGIVALAALYRGLAIGLMSVVAPIAAVAAVLPVLVGAARGETPSGLQNGGIALALAGVVLVSRTRAGRPPGARFARGAGLGLMAALGFGLFFVSFDAAATDDPYWATLLLRLGTTALVALAALRVRPLLSVTRRDLLLLVCVGVFDLGGNTLLAVATTHGVIGVVSVLSSLYPVTTIALARIVLGERIAPAQGLGGAAALVGVALISTG
jgi:uncharacterized membrane protein